MRALDGLQVVAKRPSAPGYQRGCGVGQACSFGPAWSDDVEVAGGHNGCDTRNDLLAAQLRNVEFRAGSKCVVIAGLLDNPYTGATQQFRKADAQLYPVDHIVALALAWDLGADRWSEQKRRNFANDPAELQLVDKASNDAKSDSGPADWMPTSRAYWCAYASRFIDVSARYGLAVTATDKAELSRVLSKC